jgi:hypothetical protein
MLGAFYLIIQRQTADKGYGNTRNEPDLTHEPEDVGARCSRYGPHTKNRYAPY